MSGGEKKMISISMIKCYIMLLTLFEPQIIQVTSHYLEKQRDWSWLSDWATVEQKVRGLLPE